MHPFRILFCTLLVLAPGANADTPETMARNRAVYARHAGAPVDSVRAWKFYDWLPLGEDALAVWTRPNAGVYFIEVDLPCNGLDYARTIGITSTQRTMDVRFDKVEFDGQRCSMRSVRPVDYDAVRADLASAREDDR
jgi:hypothetical protein